MIDLSFFRGARPKIEPHLLEVGEATAATNCRLQTGGLAPFRGATTIQAVTLPTVQTIHRFGDTSFWFEFAGHVNVAEGPLPSDTETTTYFTGDGEPAITYAGLATSAPPYPSNRYRLGIPAPATSMTVAVAGTADTDDLTPESRAYVVTYVSARGEEGPPSPVSAVIDVYNNQTVDISNIPTAPTGNYNITTKRIYRTATASGDTDYQFVAEIPVATLTYNDAVATEALGEVLPSVTWDPPPDGMQGLIALRNGVMAGFEGKELYLCEPFIPHAWPYKLTMDRPIVGIVGVSGGVVVATDGQPVVVSFTHPASASDEKLDTARACVSSRSMVDMGDFAVYATADGLVAVDGAGNAPLITQQVIDSYEWGQYNPETIHAYRLHDWYIAFYQGVNGNAGFAITARGDGYVDLDFYAEAGYSDPREGALYLVIGTNIVRWDDDAVDTLAYQWRSGAHIAPRPVNLGAARVEADSYPATGDTSLVFNLYADGNLVHAHQVTSRAPFRLPGGYLARQFEVELTGTRKVTRVMAAQSVDELT